MTHMIYTLSSAGFHRQNTPTMFPDPLTPCPPPPPPVLLPVQMLAELAISLRDDLRPHMPELLPRLVALFVDAERTGNFEMVKPGLEALEVQWLPCAALCCAALSAWSGVVLFGAAMCR